MSDYELNQVFISEYPIEAAEFCNDSGLYHIEEIEKTEAGERQFKIVENQKPTEEEKETWFNNNFFKTSLGYIKRQITIKTGETKDFLFDLLPSIAAGVQAGREITVSTYSLPDFTQDVADSEYLNSLKEKKTVTETFINECYEQLNSDYSEE